MILLAPLAFLGTLWGLAPAASAGAPWWVAAAPCALGGAALVVARRPAHVAGGLALLAVALALLHPTTAGGPPPGTALARQVGEGQVAALRGVVVDQPVPRERAQRLRLRVDAVRSREGEWWPASGYAQVTARPVPPLHYGEILELRGKVETPEAGAGLSYGAYLRRQGIVAVVAFPRVARLGQAQGEAPWRNTLFALRDRLASGIEALLPEPQAALVQGILIGRRTTLPATLQEQLSRSGTSHLIAVSGYNVSLVVGLALAVAGGRARRRGRLPVVLLASGTLWAFVLLVGPSGSVLRAAAMAQLALVGQAFGRQGAAGGLLLWGGAFLAALHPGLVHDVGWQLSFLGTAGLIWLAPTISAALGRLPPLVRDGLAGSVAAQVAVLPVLAGTFGRISLVAPLANVLALPLVPPIMVLGAGAVLADAVLPPTAPLLAALTWVPATALIRIVEGAAALPGAERTLPPWSPLLTGAYLAALAGLCAALQWRAQRGDQAGGLAASGAATPQPLPQSVAGVPAGGASLPVALLGVLLALAVVGWQMVDPGAALAARPTLLFSVPAVADGTLALLRAPDGARVLVNGGPGAGSATSLLGEQLRPWDRTVDTLVLADPGEASLLGLPRVLERYRVGVLMDAAPGYPSGEPSASYRQVLETARRRGVPRLRVAPGSAFAVGAAVRLEVLDVSPPPGTPAGPLGAVTEGRAAGDTNRAYLPAWRLCWGDFTVLIPGDGRPGAETAGGPADRWAALPGAARPRQSTVLLLTERTAYDPAVARLVGDVRPEVVVVQGEPRAGSMPARSATKEIVRPPDSGAPYWHFTASDGPLRLEARPGAIRVVGREWRRLTRG